MKRALRHLTASLTMVFGCAGVLALVHTMNDLNQPPSPDAKKVRKDFKVEKQPKKPETIERKKAPPKKSVRTAQSAAPMPNIASAMSGLSFDLPQFQNDELLGADRLLSSADAGKRLVMTGDSVDILPKPRTRKSPEYPNKARERGIEGHIVLNIRVNERGDVEQVRVVDSEPIGVFDSVAVAAVSDWTFDPAQYQGQPVAVSVSQRIPFRLN